MKVFENASRLVSLSLVFLNFPTQMVLHIPLLCWCLRLGIRCSNMMMEVALINIVFCFCWCMSLYTVTSCQPNSWKLGLGCTNIVSEHGFIYIQFLAPPLGCCLCLILNCLIGGVCMFLFVLLGSFAKINLHSILCRDFFCSLDNFWIQLELF